jgi:hypothetical protein
VDERPVFFRRRLLRLPGADWGREPSTELKVSESKMMPYPPSERPHDAEISGKNSSLALALARHINRRLTNSEFISVYRFTIGILSRGLIGVLLIAAGVSVIGIENIAQLKFCIGGLLVGIGARLITSSQRLSNAIYDM